MNAGMGAKPKVGLIGAGFIGGVHARALRAAGVPLAVVADRTAEGARAAVVRLGAQAAAGSAEELLASDVDVVHICTPNHLHAP
ncbi:MAG: Gfo/Idh/MocA family oxidoreductase, partial [Actinomycetota bacterium]|nr:Gfo/Idh/MocA family oxidoreductase [Actinomycetota bacterium]